MNKRYLKVETKDEVEVTIQEVRREERHDGDWFRKPHDFFAPAIQGAIERGYSDEEITEWIDPALAEFRLMHRDEREAPNSES